jgi:hypothetical protein
MGEPTSGPASEEGEEEEELKKLYLLGDRLPTTKKMDEAYTSR